MRMVLIVCLIMMPSLLMAQEVSLTLDDALIIALRDNRQVRLQIEEVQKAKAKINEAKASLWPTLNVSGGWNDTRGYFSKDINQATTQATLKQTLYNGGNIVNTIKKNKDNLEVVQAVLDETKLNLIGNVKKAFYTLLIAREFVQLNQK